MSDGEQSKPGGNGNDPSTGPNLVLLYSLIGLALAAAIGLAALIVRPFYLRH
ncbi:MAG: hypothetical protein ACLPLZ_16965 [Terracidiphilus sp.]|jgi:hypothetical protein